MRKLLLVALAVLVLVPASASAFTVQEVGGLNSPASGIALGPDGNIWAAEEAAESVVRVSPSGAILGRIPVGGEPFGVAAGPGGRVWTTMPESHELVWFDATSPTPTAHHVSTGPAKCGPAAIADGGNGLMYFTMPFEGGACASEIGHVNADGSGFVSTATVAGTAYDIAISGGKLYSPDFDADKIRRLGLPALNLEAEIGTPAGGGPQSLAADGGGNIWVTLFNTGRLAYFPAGAAGGNATALTPTGGSLVEPFGIVAGSDGKMYVPGVNSQLLAATALPTFAFTPMPAGSEPWDIANGPNGDLWITDLASNRLLHLFNPAPAPPASGGSASTQPLAKPLPKLSLTGKSKQKLGSFVQLTVSCPTGACSVSGGGTMTVKPAGGKPTQPKLKKATVQVPAGKKVVLKVKIPSKAKAAAAEALATKGGKASAKVTLSAKDANGTSPSAIFKVKLKK